jgi:hypothetical protein
VNTGGAKTEVVVVGASVVVDVEAAVVVVVVLVARVVDVAGVVDDLDCRRGPVLSVPDDPHAPVVTRITTAIAPTRRWSCTAS